MSMFYTYGYGMRLAVVLLYYTVTVALIFIALRGIIDRAGRMSAARNIAITFFFIVMTTVLAQCHFYTFRTNQYKVELPLYALAVILLAGGAYAVSDMIRGFCARRSRVTWNTVREALDNIPVGICYFDNDGLPRLSNSMMLTLAIRLTGSDFQSLDELRQSIVSVSQAPESGAGGDEVGIIEPERRGVTDISEKADVPGVPDIIVFPDGRTYSYTEKPMTTENGDEFTGTFLFDITELQDKRTELEAQTEALRKISAQLKYLNENAYKLAREEEILAFQTRLHDAMGAGLTAVHRMLELDLPWEDQHEAIRVWRRSLDMIITGEDMSGAEGSLGDFCRDAEALGVRFSMTGEMPDDRDIEEVFMTALHTGLTNCIKHAEATEMTAVIESADGECEIVITNNGRPPDGDIRPGGGIKNLADRAHRLGGSVEISAAPEFVLKVVVPAIREEYIL